MPNARCFVCVPLFKVNATMLVLHLHTLSFTHSFSCFVVDDKDQTSFSTESRASFHLLLSALTSFCCVIECHLVLLKSRSLSASTNTFESKSSWGAILQVLCWIQQLSHLTPQFASSALLFMLSPHLHCRNPT